MEEVATTANPNKPRRKGRGGRSGFHGNDPKGHGRGRGNGSARGQRSPKIELPSSESSNVPGQVVTTATSTSTSTSRQKPARGMDRKGGRGRNPRRIETTSSSGEQAKRLSNPATTNDRTQNKAKSKIAGFAPYQDLSRLLQRYANKEPTLIRGKIRMLWGKDALAFCTCDRGSLSRDVIIETRRDQNRSIDGDIVFVELIDACKDEDEVRGDVSATDDHDDEEIVDLISNMQGLKANDTPEQETWQDDAIQKSLWDPTIPICKVDPQTQNNTDAPPQQKGRVVFVIHPKETAGNQPSELNPSEYVKRAPRRTIVGTMTVVNMKEGNSLYLLTPSNKGLPQFLCPSSFKPATGHDDALYKAEYVYGSWKEHHNWPPCVNVCAMGRSCNVDDETELLLTENGVNHGDFPAEVLKDVHESVESGLIVDNSSPHDLGWRPTRSMYLGRRDYRAQRIFTIDPTTARDLDDALHISQLPDGRVEIGVHIADVSHFVKHNTAVDLEAERRATTVYLVDRVIPMLPRPLCEIACSLNENVERLAFSCVWKMNMDGTMENKGKQDDEVWYGKTVIKSCARLDYATAQNIIDKSVANGESPEETDETLWPKSRRPTGGHTIDQVAADVRLLHKVAMARRKLRFANGALALNGVKLSFKLDSDGETPTLCAPYPIRDSNRLVEEYMLLANFLVAQRLIAHAGKLALLRHHPPPIMESMVSVANAARLSAGFALDFTNSKSLQASLSRLGRECDDELVAQCITELLMTPMRPAEYLAAGLVNKEEWSHFALNIPYYTHFTSPIRRYADVIVHRLLESTIENTNQFELDEKAIQRICDQCNEKKTAAKAASDRSDRVFLAIYLKKNPLRSTLGAVIGVGEKTFTVFVPEIGCSGKVFLDEHKDQLAFHSHAGKDGQKQIKVTRKKATRGSKWSEFDVKFFAKITVSVSCKEKPPIDIKLRLEGPWLQ